MLSQEGPLYARVAALERLLNADSSESPHSLIMSLCTLPDAQPLLDVLLRRRPDSATAVSTDSGETPLHLAAGSVSLAGGTCGLGAACALWRHGADTFARDVRRRTPVHAAAAAGNAVFLAAARRLVDAQAPDYWSQLVNGRDTAGLTPLHLAVEAESVTATQYLLASGAEPGISDDLGRTALHLAVERACGAASSNRRARTGNIMGERGSPAARGGAGAPMRVLDALLRAGSEQTFAGAAACRRRREVNIGRRLPPSSTAVAAAASVASTAMQTGAPAALVFDVERAVAMPDGEGIGLCSAAPHTLFSPSGQESRLSVAGPELLHGWLSVDAAGESPAAIAWRWLSHKPASGQLWHLYAAVRRATALSRLAGTCNSTSGKSAGAAFFLLAREAVVALMAGLCLHLDRDGAAYIWPAMSVLAFVLMASRMQPALYASATATAPWAVAAGPWPAVSQSLYVAMLVCFWLSLVVASIAYLLTRMLDPGRLKPVSHPHRHAASDTSGCGAYSSCGAPDYIRPSGVALQAQRGFEDGLRRGTEPCTLPAGYCPTCEIVRPVRSKHCARCDACVQRFDHCCPWTGGCIGVGNHAPFIVFIVAATACAAAWLMLLHAYVTYVPPLEAAAWLHAQATDSFHGSAGTRAVAAHVAAAAAGDMIVPSTPPPSPHDTALSFPPDYHFRAGMLAHLAATPWLLLLGLQPAWMGAFGALLVWQQARFISRGLTANEVANHDRYAYLKDPVTGRFTNPFSRGRGGANCAHFWLSSGRASWAALRALVARPCGIGADCRQRDQTASAHGAAFGEATARGDAARVPAASDEQATAAVQRDDVTADRPAAISSAPLRGGSAEPAPAGAPLPLPPLRPVAHGCRAPHPLGSGLSALARGADSPAFVIGTPLSHSATPSATFGDRPGGPCAVGVGSDSAAARQRHCGPPIQSAAANVLPASPVAPAGAAAGGGALLLGLGHATPHAPALFLTAARSGGLGPRPRAGFGLLGAGRGVAVAGLAVNPRAPFLPPHLNPASSSHSASLSSAGSPAEDPRSVAGSVRSSTASAHSALAALHPVATGPWQPAPLVEGTGQESL
jgi:hypothetical protein